MMLRIRPAAESDMDQLLGLSADVGVGMTSMPADRATWRSRIGHSCRSFAQPAPDASTEQTYFMVMEEMESRQVFGTTAVYAGVGHTDPFYSYKLSTLVQASEALGVTVQRQVLFLVNDYTGATELGSLYLTPSMRRDGNGRFLSRCRYLLLADFPDRFGEAVIAEMRGWQDAQKRSPFWTHLGKKFFGIAFANADYHSAVKGSQIITDLMPRYPIYVDLLPAQAQQVIGCAHADSRPALKLLEREGFHFEGYVDVFDGGPTVRCDRDAIHSVASSGSARFAGVMEHGDGRQCLVSNSRLARYRIVRSAVALERPEWVRLPAEAAAALELEAGDPLRYLEE